MVGQCHSANDFMASHFLNKCCPAQTDQMRGFGNHAFRHSERRQKIFAFFLHQMFFQIKAIPQCPAIKLAIVAGRSEWPYLRPTGIA